MTPQEQKARDIVAAHYSLRGSQKFAAGMLDALDKIPIAIRLHSQEVALLMVAMDAWIEGYDKALAMVTGHQKGLGGQAIVAAAELQANNTGYRVPVAAEKARAAQLDKEESDAIDEILGGIWRNFAPAVRSGMATLVPGWTSRFGNSRLAFVQPSVPLAPYKGNVMDQVYQSINASNAPSTPGNTPIAPAATINLQTYNASSNNPQASAVPGLLPEKVVLQPGGQDVQDAVAAKEEKSALVKWLWYYALAWGLWQVWQASKK